MDAAGELISGSGAWADYEGYMNSAARVISKFGSQSALARLLGTRQSTVQYWAKTGVIPQGWHRPLLQLAVDRGVDLQPSEFVDSGGRDHATDAPQPRGPGTLTLRCDECQTCLTWSKAQSVRVVFRELATFFEEHWECLAAGRVGAREP